MRGKIIFAILGLLALPCLAYLLFPWYAKPLLNLVLNEHDIEVVTLRTDRPGWHSLAIDELSLTHADAGGIFVDDTTVRFYDLFSRFDIDIAYLRWERPARDDTSTPSTTPVSRYLPGSYLPAVPTLAVSVNTFDVFQSREQQNLLLARFNRTNLKKADDRLRLLSRLSGADHYELNLLLTDKNQFNLAVTREQQDKPLIRLDGGGQHTGQTLIFDASFSLNVDEPVRLNTQLDEIIAGFTGHLDAGLRAQLKNVTITELLARPVMQITGSFDGELASPDRQMWADAGVAFNLDLNEGHWQVGLANINEREGDAVLLRKGLDGRDHVVALNFGKTFRVAGTTDAGSDVQADAESILNIRHTVGNEKVAEAKIGHVAWNGQLPGSENFNAYFTGTVHGDLSALLKQAEIDGLGADDSQLDLVARVGVDNTKLAISIESGSGLRAGKIHYQDSQASQARVRFPVQTVVFDLAGRSMDKLTFTLQADDFSTGNYTLSPIDVSGEASFMNRQGRFTLGSDTMKLRQGESKRVNRVPPHIVDGTAVLAGYSAGLQSAGQQPAGQQAGGQTESGVSLAGLDLRLLNQCRTELLTANWRPDSGFALRAEKTFSEKNSLRHWLNLPELTVDVTQGRLAAHLYWQTADNQKHPRLDLNLADADFTGSLGTFDDVQVSLSTLPAQSAYTLNAKAKTLNIGTQIKDFTMQAEISNIDESMSATIRQMNAKVLGGRVLIEDQRWVSGQDSVIRVQLDNVDLAEVIRTQNIENISTTGRMSGVLPVKLDEQGLSLAGGYLSNTQGGVIRYRSAMSDSESLNQQLQLTLDVLENFKYQMLNTTVDYSEGNLVLRSNILGSNPDVAGGQKIDLNLNTEIELKSAFQAMRLQAGLEAQVENLFSGGNALSSQPFCQQSP